ncbi:unnamed protein product [Chrysodeixis includens]|uniref:C2H2-type domain-containing protein n=1 Tax=Chrysodeixis includens TaxID=689277 RepID=A0A9P0FX84_CHRIL|nr:unnamed protein product [Chrysodeixis includens]
MLKPIMASIQGVLSSVINRKDDICCLCLSKLHVDPIRLDYQVVMNVNKYEYDTVMEEVITFLFNEQMCNYVKAFNTLCEECGKAAITCYKFMQTCQKNSEYLTHVFEGITNSFDYTTDELDSKSLYVSLNLEDFTSKQFYDTKRGAKDRKAALKHFLALDRKSKITEEVCHKKMKEENEANTSVKKTRRKTTIPTTKMLDQASSDERKCKECKKTFLSNWNLRNHYIRVHAPKDFKCPECPRSYGSAAYLAAHKSESHCTVVCSECGKTFHNRHTLKMHEKGHHLSLVCQHCGRVYKNKSTFKKHVDLNICGQKARANPSEGKFTCDYCNKKYTQKISLRVHIQYEHGNYKAHICKFCNKKFWAQSRLKAHLVKHTREKKFTCSTCGGKFVSKESLLYHTRTHTGEKPYKCPHCDVRFLSASRRSDHVKRHHLGAELECETCHSKFSSRTFLLKHKKTHSKCEVKMNRNSESTAKSSIESQNPNMLETEESTVLWQINKVEEDEPCFEEIMDCEVDLNFDNKVYENDGQHCSEDGKVYLEVSDDTDEYMKMLSKM